MPTPSCHSSFTRSPLRSRKQKISPPCGSRPTPRLAPPTRGCSWSPVVSPPVEEIAGDALVCHPTRNPHRRACGISNHDGSSACLRRVSTTGSIVAEIERRLPFSRVISARSVETGTGFGSGAGGIAGASGAASVRGMNRSGVKQPPPTRRRDIDAASAPAARRNIMAPGCLGQPKQPGRDDRGDDRAQKAGPSDGGHLPGGRP